MIKRALLCYFAPSHKYNAIFSCPLFSRFPPIFFQVLFMSNWYFVICRLGGEMEWVTRYIPLERMPGWKYSDCTPVEPEQLMWSGSQHSRYGCDSVDRNMPNLTRVSWLEDCKARIQVTCNLLLCRLSSALLLKQAIKPARGWLERSVAPVSQIVNTNHS